MANRLQVVASIVILAIISIVSLTSAQGAAYISPERQETLPRVETQAPAIELIFVSEYQLRWWDQGSGADYDGAFYMPVVPDGYYALGSYGQGNYGTPFGPMFVARELEPGALAAPVDYEWIWSDWGSGADMDGSFWRPTPPMGYICLGDVAQTGYSKPNLDAIRCLRSDLVTPAEASTMIWIDQGSGADYDFGSWRILPSVDEAIYVGTFIGNSTWSPPGIPLFSVRSDAVALPDSLSLTEAHALIQQYGPLMYFHHEESYFMDSPEWSLDNGIILNWALVENEWDYDTHLESNLAELPTSALDFRDDFRYVLNEIKPYPPYNNSELFRLWLKVPDALKPGDLSRADSLVRVVPWNTLLTEIQFWFYYPYNGPGRAEVCISGAICDYIQMDECGRHYSDWEHVSLVFDANTKELVYVYMSAHGGGHWYPRATFGDPLTFYNSTHPIIYAAKFSHAHYATQGYHDYLRVVEYDYGIGTFSVDLYDLTAMGAEFHTFLPENYRIISSAFTSLPVPGWLRFTGRWGQYEKLSDQFDYSPIYTYTYKEVGAGPSGSNMKTAWQVGDLGDLLGWPENPVNLFRQNYLPAVHRGP